MAKPNPSVFQFDGHAVVSSLCRLMKTRKCDKVDTVLDIAIGIAFAHCGRQLLIGYNEELAI